MKPNLHVEEIAPVAPGAPHEVNVPVQQMTQEDMIQTLEHHASYYKQKADELEQKLVLTQSELKRHAAARVRAETELQMLRASIETKQ